MVSTPRANKEASGYKTFSSDQLKEFVEVQTWLKNVSPGSTKVYLRALWMFCNWCKRSPHELIMQRDKEIRIADQNGITGDGEIAVISFTVVNQTGSSLLLIEDLLVYDVDSLEIDATPQSGTFTVTKSSGENGGTTGFEMVLFILSLIAVLSFTRTRERKK